MTEDLDAAAPVGGAFLSRMDVRWGDLDALGHVNNAVYFRYFEEARVRLGVAIGLFDGTDRTGVLAHASCDFLKPLLYPARIIVGLKILRLGRTSLELETWIARADTPEDIYARGRNIFVCADRATGRPSAWTDADRQALARCFSV
uniref:acyl-CoA thioesterase n=1 Tax=Castellaniella defragrans TaxID=75697 RepID=UPI00333E9FA6